MHTYVATFFTHYDAVQLANRAKAKGLEAKLMPVPRALSSSCGTGAQLLLQNEAQLPALLGEGVDKVYLRQGEGYTLCYSVDDDGEPTGD